MNCPHCNAPYVPGANFCFNCGKPPAFTHPSFQHAAVPVARDKSLFLLGIFVCWKVFSSLCWFLMTRLLFPDYHGSIVTVIRFVSLFDDIISVGLLITAAVLSKNRTMKVLLFIALGVQAIISICYQLFVY